MTGNRAEEGEYDYPEVTPVEAVAAVKKVRRERRLFGKFYVERRDERDAPGGDKYGARYFVLDYWHDPHARRALSAYAESVHAESPDFAADLRAALIETDVSGAPWRRGNDPVGPESPR